MNSPLGSQSALLGSSQDLQAGARGEAAPGDVESIEPFPGLAWAVVGRFPRGPWIVRIAQGLGSSVPLLDCRVGPLPARAIAVLVQHSWDELRSEGDDHPIGNDCQHADDLQHLQPGP